MTDPEFTTTNFTIPRELMVYFAAVMIYAAYIPKYSDEPDKMRRWAVDEANDLVNDIEDLQTKYTVKKDE